MTAAYIAGMKFEDIIDVAGVVGIFLTAVIVGSIPCAAVGAVISGRSGAIVGTIVGAILGGSIWLVGLHLVVRELTSAA